MRLCSIASGSSGNCIYIGSDNTHLLVDTGISKKRIEEGLAELDVRGEELSGIFITHEHVDHIQGLGVFSRKYNVPIYVGEFAIESKVAGREYQQQTIADRIQVFEELQIKNISGKNVCIEMFIFVVSFALCLLSMNKMC